jgi:hypothetical protein
VHSTALPPLRSNKINYLSSFTWATEALSGASHQAGRRIAESGTLRAACHVRNLT